MTIKRFSIMNLDPSGAWEPCTLAVDSASSRSETLAFAVTSTRGRGSLLARGEAWAEKRQPRAFVGQTPAPRGHEVIEFRLAPTEAQAQLDREAGVAAVYAFATVVGDEIIQGTKDLRRNKPRTPSGRMADDEIWTCKSCGARTMSRGSDHPGWKGVQMSPKSPTYTYFCGKAPCGDERDKAIEVAKVNWGYESTAGADPEKQPPPAEGAAPEQGKYGPPAPKPFAMG